MPSFPPLSPLPPRLQQWLLAHSQLLFSLSGLAMAAGASMLLFAGWLACASAGQPHPHRPRKQRRDGGSRMRVQVRPDDDVDEIPALGSPEQSGL